MTEFYKICIVLEHCIPRLCNGSTSDSGSDCGGSNPPWGTKRGCPERIIAVVNIIWQLSSLRTASFFWPLRITASTADSHSVNRSSILLGASFFLKDSTCFVLSFFLFNGKNRIELRKERFWNCEQCGAIPKFSAREGGKSESRRRRRRKQEVFDCRASILLGAIDNNFETALVRCCLFLFSLNVEFFVKRIKAQADLQFVKIFGD